MDGICNEIELLLTITNLYGESIEVYNEPGLDFSYTLLQQLNSLLTSHIILWKKVSIIIVKSSFKKYLTGKGRKYNFPTLPLLDLSVYRGLVLHTW